MGIVGKAPGRHLAVNAQLLEPEGCLNVSEAEGAVTASTSCLGAEGPWLALAWPGGRPPGEGVRVGWWGQQVAWGPAGLEPTSCRRAQPGSQAPGSENGSVPDC